MNESHVTDFKYCGVWVQLVCDCNTWLPQDPLSPQKINQRLWQIKHGSVLKMKPSEQTTSTVERNKEVKFLEYFKKIRKWTGTIEATSSVRARFYLRLQKKTISFADLGWRAVFLFEEFDVSPNFTETLLSC